MNESTAQSVMDALEGMAARKETIGPELWMQAASKLNVLLQVEQDKLIELRSLLSKVKASHIEQGKSVAYANTIMEAMDEWVVYEKQKALIERAIETIRLAKKNATLESDLRRNS